MKWSYKTIHFELKKEGLLGAGFLDETEVEQALNEYGSGGWELVSVLEVNDGIIAFFKQPLSLKRRYRYQEEEAGEGAQPDEDETTQSDDYASRDTAQSVVSSTPESPPENSVIGAIKIE